MRPALPTTWLPALATALLALGATQPLAAQDDSGLTSGSGVGTGTGESSRYDRPPGEEAVIESPGVPGSPLMPPGAVEGDVPLGPGVNVRFPNDPALAPFLSLEEAEAEDQDAQSRSRIRREMLDVANKLDSPGERGRVLLQIARGALLGGQVRLAHQAIEDAASAAMNETNDLIHDQLIISIVTTTGLLAETLLREAKPQTLLFEDFGGGGGPGQLPPETAIRFARLEWRRSAYMASLIRNPTYRSEYLQHSVANMAEGSATIALEYAGPTSAGGPKGAPDDEEIAEYKRQADEILTEAVSFAREIERPIWKNRAMELIATAAGQSDQNDRADEIAGTIQNAEARARALVLVAEFQARRGQNTAATRSYGKAAEAVASIPDHGLRGVLSGILVDSLISTGRFDDARACVSLYPTDSQKFVAMGAIAESLGTRRMNDEARRWIDNDVAPEYRSTLYRRLSNGMLRAITEERAKEFQGGSY